jgi:hypothetical protein
VKIVENGGTFRFDLNHDGIADFALSNRGVSTSSRNYGVLRVVPESRSNEIWEVTPKNICAAALSTLAGAGEGQYSPANLVDYSYFDRLRV